MFSDGERAWQAMMELLRSQKQHMAASFTELHLTEPLANAMSVIPRKGVTMRVMADLLHCDPANVTGLIDRLEKRGLVERRLDTQDRRIRRVFLTAAGRRIRDRVEERFTVPPPPIRALSNCDQRTLREILDRTLCRGEEKQVWEEA